ISVASGTGASTFPQSSQIRPSCWMRASSPAYRIADGPMSTPRRPAPRSRGPPITATAFCGCADTARKANFPGVTAGVAGGDRIRVLLADDDVLFLESLRPLVDGQDELTVVGSAGNGLAAIELVEELRPDALVIDLHMPLIDG